MTSTSRDVARAAGVSVATVSRAFSEAGAVSDSTRGSADRGAAPRLQPEPAARRLITGRSGNIGIIVPDLANPFFADIIKGVQRRAREGARRSSSRTPMSRPVSRATRCAALPVSRRIILASPRSAIEDCQETSTFHRSHPSAGTGLVERDRRLRGRRPTGPCEPAGAGHDHVATPESSPVVVRWHAYGVAEDVRRRAGVHLYELGSVAPTIDGGLAAADLALATPATALIAYNDVVALGAMRRFGARGVDVPAACRWSAATTRCCRSSPYRRSPPSTCLGSKRARPLSPFSTATSRTPTRSRSSRCSRRHSSSVARRRRRADVSAADLLLLHRTDDVYVALRPLSAGELVTAAARSRSGCRGCPGRHKLADASGAPESSSASTARSSALS